jgi:predicted DsbA family dithiol-disulfide isomerase
LAKAAADIGLGDVRGKLADETDTAEIEREALAAKEAGIQGVPMYIFGGRFAVSGAQAPEYLAQAIERAAAEGNAEAAE